MDRRRAWWLAGGGCAALAVVGVVAGVLASPDDGPAPLPIRARQYTGVRACLLTDSQGLGGDGVAPVWGGMQDASGATKAQVSWLAVPGEESVGRAMPFANTLVQQKCSMVLAAGGVAAQALAAVADANPSVRFVVVGQGQAKSNLSVVPAGGGTRAAVAELVSGVAATAR